MREIKFRAWDKIDKEINCIVDFDFTGAISIPVRDTNNGDWILGQRLFKDVEIMQYTGLKDRNGVEIYEGDIVHCESKDGVNVYYNDTVQFKAGAFYPVCEVPEKEKWFEVIGNIYQNPELLK